MVAYIIVPPSCRGTRRQITASPPYLHTSILPCKSATVDLPPSSQIHQHQRLKSYPHTIPARLNLCEFRFVLSPLKKQRQAKHAVLWNLRIECIKRQETMEREKERAKERGATTTNRLFASELYIVAPVGAIIHS